MYPILYNSDGIYFHNGKGKLVDCISCVVSEELNGDYSLEFAYPITGPLFNELLEGGSVSVICPHMRLITGTGFVPMRAAEWFDIYKHSIPINGVVTFYANHVSRRLARLVYAGGKIGTGTGSVDGVLNRSQPSVANGYDGLRFYATPYSPPAVIDKDVPVQSVLATYIGADNSFVSNFGGDFIWTSDSLYNTQYTPPLTTRGYYVAHRGEDRGAEIRYGFNMTDVKNVEDSIDTYNAVVPYWEDSDGNRVFANGFLVQSDPPQTPIRAVPLNCSAWYDTAPTSEQLISTAQNHLANHTPWNVVETLTVDFINGVEIDPHGAEIALGDTVHIYWKDGKIDATLRVVSYKYDALAERYSELKLGTQQTHFVAVTGAESYSGATGGGGSGGGLPSGGTQGQVLFKNSSADGDAIWSDLPKPMMLLWTFDGNKFAAQTVELDLSEYDMVLIRVHAEPSGGAYPNIGDDVFCRVGESRRLICNAQYFHTNASASSYWLSRLATVTTTGITFSNEYSINITNNARSSNNTFCIPYEIYGIKTGSALEV